MHVDISVRWYSTLNMVEAVIANREVREMCIIIIHTSNKPYRG